MKFKVRALFFKERRELRFYCEQLQDHLEVRTKLDREDVSCLYVVVSDLKHCYETRIGIVTMKEWLLNSPKDEGRGSRTE
jgi:hypothetical protein